MTQKQVLAGYRLSQGEKGHQSQVPDPPVEGASLSKQQPPPTPSSLPANQKGVHLDGDLDSLKLFLVKIL